MFKKLELSRETLRVLNPDTINGIAAGTASVVEVWSDATMTQCAANSCSVEMSLFVPRDAPIRGIKYKTPGC